MPILHLHLADEAATAALGARLAAALLGRLDALLAPRTPPTGPHDDPRVPAGAPDTVQPKPAAGADLGGPPAAGSGHGADPAADVPSEVPAVAASGLITLSGPLGAGKTALVRAILRALGVQGTVRSPTFTLLEPYAVSRLDLYHLDFYRLKSPAEAQDLGLRELFGAGCLCLVEWPQRAEDELPVPDLAIALSIPPPPGAGAGGSGRDAALRAGTQLGEDWLRHLMQPGHPT